MALTQLQENFVNEYLVDFNATRAAQRAGYKGTDASLATIGWENLRKLEIAEAVSQRLQEKAMGADEVLMRLAEQARNEHGRYIDENGSVNLSLLIADGKGHLIKGVKETQFGRNIEFYDAQSALGLLAKHHGLLNERNEHSGEVTVRVVYDGKGNNGTPAPAPPETA